MLGAVEISGDREAASGGTEKGKGKIVYIQLQARLPPPSTSKCLWVSESTMLDIHQEQRVNFTGDPPNSQFPHDFVHLSGNGNIAAVDSGFPPPPPPRPPPNHNHPIPRKRQWGPPQGTLYFIFILFHSIPSQSTQFSFLLQIKSMLRVMLKFTLHLFLELHLRLM